MDINEYNDQVTAFLAELVETGKHYIIVIALCNNDFTESMTWDVIRQLNLLCNGEGIYFSGAFKAGGRVELHYSQAYPEFSWTHRKVIQTALDRFKAEGAYPTVLWGVSPLEVDRPPIVAPYEEKERGYFDPKYLQELLDEPLKHLKGLWDVITKNARQYWYVGVALLAVFIIPFVYNRGIK